MNGEGWMRKGVQGSSESEKGWMGKGVRGSSESEKGWMGRGGGIGRGG